MVSTINRVTPAQKYGVVLGGSFLLWIAPVSIKAPRLVTFAAFITSISGFAYAYCLAGQVTTSTRYTRLRNAQQRELLNYQFALEEVATKEQLKLQFFPQPQTVNVQSQALPPQSQKQSTLEVKQQKLLDLEPHLELILECAIENEGSITPRQAMRFKGLANKHTAEEMRAYFHALESLGLGTVLSDPKRKDSISFSVDDEILRWVQQ